MIARRLVVDGAIFVYTSAATRVLRSFVWSSAATRAGCCHSFVWTSAAPEKNLQILSWRESRETKAEPEGRPSERGSPNIARNFIPSSLCLVLLFWPSFWLFLGLPGVSSGKYLKVFFGGANGRSSLLVARKSYSNTLWASERNKKTHVPIIALLFRGTSTTFCCP